MNEEFEKTFKYEELKQIIKAVLFGKYSWACVLFLHFAGYNPLDFIPYRTYNRLLKKNGILDKINYHPLEQNSLEFFDIKSNGIQYRRDKHDLN